MEVNGPRRASLHDRLRHLERISITRGWDPGVLSMAAARYALAGRADARVALRCVCGKRLDELRVVPLTDRDGRDLTYVVDGTRPRYTPAGGDTFGWGRLQYRCPLARCGARPVLRRDRLTRAFIEALDRPPREIRVDRLPRAA